MRFGISSDKVAELGVVLHRRRLLGQLHKQGLQFWLVQVVAHVEPHFEHVCSVLIQVLLGNPVLSMLFARCRLKRCSDVLKQLLKLGNLVLVRLQLQVLHNCGDFPEKLDLLVKRAQVAQNAACQRWEKPAKPFALHCLVELLAELGKVLILHRYERHDCTHLVGLESERPIWLIVLFLQLAQKAREKALRALHPQLLHHLAEEGERGRGRLSTRERLNLAHELVAHR